MGKNPAKIVIKLKIIYPTREFLMQTNKQTSKQTNKQTNKQINNKQINKQTAE